MTKSCRADWHHDSLSLLVRMSVLKHSASFLGGLPEGATEGSISASRLSHQTVLCSSNYKSPPKSMGLQAVLIAQRLVRSRNICNTSLQFLTLLPEVGIHRCYHTWARVSGLCRGQNPALLGGATKPWFWGGGNFQHQGGQWEGNIEKFSRQKATKSWFSGHFRTFWGKNEKFPQFCFKNVKNDCFLNNFQVTFLKVSGGVDLQNV